VSSATKKKADDVTDGLVESEPQELSRDQIQALAKKVRDFEPHLVEMLPEAQLPRPYVEVGLNTSQLLFEYLFRFDDWRAAALQGRVPLHPTYVLDPHHEPPVGGDRVALFLTALDRRIEERLQPLDMADDPVLVPRYRELVASEDMVRLSPLPAYRVRLAVRWLANPNAKYFGGVKRPN
jgi:hypothetical protein